jgi:hypothetical protein
VPASVGERRGRGGAGGRDRGAEVPAVGVAGLPGR